MTRSCASLIGALLVLGLSSPYADQTSAGPEQTLLSRVKTAMGGARVLDAVKTLRIDVSRSARTVRSGDPVSETYTLQFLAPDHYLHLSKTWMGRPRPGRRGFAGTTSISSIGGIAWAEPEACGYLMLALLLRVDTPFSFQVRGAEGATLTYVAKNGVEVFMDIDSVTFLPRRLRFNDIGRDRAGRPLGTTVQTRWELSDYQPVGKLRLAHRMVRHQDQREQDDRRFVYELNPPLVRSDFKEH